MQQRASCSPLALLLAATLTQLAACDVAELRQHERTLSAAASIAQHSRRQQGMHRPWRTAPACGFGSLVFLVDWRLLDHARQMRSTCGSGIRACTTSLLCAGLQSSLAMAIMCAVAVVRSDPGYVLSTGQHSSTGSSFSSFCNACSSQKPLR